MLEHVSLPEAVTRVLRHRILNNEIPADSRLVEANLAAKFGVSRGTIRDAMRGLQAEGLIDIVPRRYSVVTRMSTEDAEDVCYARYVLEEASISRGLPHYGNELAKELQAAIEAMAAAVQANDLDALVESVGAAPAEATLVHAEQPDGRGAAVRDRASGRRPVERGAEPSRSLRRGDRRRQSAVARCAQGALSGRFCGVAPRVRRGSRARFPVARDPDCRPPQALTCGVAPGEEAGPEP
jgi:Mn-dependent DtxR family transcriptional regulator